MIELVIVSRLLEYPDAALWQHQQEMFEAIAASKNLPKEDAHALGIFLRDLTTMDPLDAQAQYSELFDRGRATSLLLLNMCTANPATAARRWWTCWRSTSSTACS
ncbi:respiratory nitrate reductase 1 subunit delta [Escherichia coli]|nr:respiratory nitrate reductase 1 subunit delta [Escherichia coli]